MTCSNINYTVLMQFKLASFEGNLLNAVGYRFCIKTSRNFLGQGRSRKVFSGAVLSNVSSSLFAIENAVPDRRWRTYEVG